LTDPKPFADRLLDWWEIHGRHDLPWQHPRTPYRVWVSEIMLQQTQVTTVIPYFARFMDRFPGLTDLAGAPLDAVLALWAGLGYYARARNLHKAAVICQDEHGGALPDDATALAALPGIGESTANAIVSQSRDIPAAVVDGNVRRVLARHRAVDGWPGKAEVNRKLWQIAEANLPSARGADYTQAIMDLGATVCTRGQPGCEACPVSGDCLAFSAGEVGRYPASRPKARVREQALFMLLATRSEGGILLERRPPAGIWGGLWCLPTAESVERLAAGHGVEPTSFHPLPEVEHRLSHRLLRITPLELRSEPGAGEVECRDNQAWLYENDWRQLGLPRPVAELLNRYVNGEKQ
jgi:A/G-specific adenine glycosylase